MADRIKPGTRCRYKIRGSIEAEALGDVVVVVVRAHPIFPAMCEVEGSNGFKTWVPWDDLYELKQQASEPEGTQGDMAPELDREKVLELLLEAPACFWFGRPPCPRCGKEHGDPEASAEKDLLLRMLYEKCVELGEARRERDEARYALSGIALLLRKAVEERDVLRAAISSHKKAVLDNQGTEEEWLQRERIDAELWGVLRG